MVVLALQLLGIVLNVWAESEVEMKVEGNVTGILGEEVVLQCQYMGQHQLIMSSWALEEGSKSTTLVVYLDKPLVMHEDFGPPASQSNLTVSLRITSLEAEKQYLCIFTSLSGSVKKNVFLTVLVRPDVLTNVEEAVDNGTHYQIASCSAIAGKPTAVVRWSIYGNRAMGGAFSVAETTVQHHNGTSTRTSVLRFPTHLQDSAEVTCVISHPALPEVVMETVRVQTFVAPNVTLVTRSGDEGAELQEVMCVAAGGRPAPNITWLPPGNAPEVSPVVQEQWDEETNTVTVISSVSLQAYLFEGENVTCAVTHPKLPQQLEKTITLPIYELSSARVLRVDSAEMYPGNEVEGQVVLMEGQKNVRIQVEVTGNVPRYKVTCDRENSSLPSGVEVIGSVLHFEGPMEPLHAGLYTCQASYYSHILSVPLEIVVTPAFVRPVVVAPRVKIQSWEDADYRIVKCSASDAFPAANVSWSLPEAISGTIQSNSTFRNGTHSVTSILRLPVCSPWELVIECMIEHPALMTSETLSMALPACASPNISINSSSVWDKGTEYTEVECSVNGGRHGANISWSVEDRACEGCASGLAESMMGNQTQQDGSELAWSQLRLPTRLAAGRVVTCIVDHPALRAPERRKIWIPLLPEKWSLGSPQTVPPVPWVLVVSLGRLKMSMSWLAICEAKGAAANVSVSWVLPKNSTGSLKKSLAKSTYEFSLAEHEGKSLTCLLRDEHSTTETTLHIPQFYISSLRVLNKTTSYRWPLEEGPVTYRVALQPHTPGQKILLQVYGNVPQSHITCSRSDGTAVQMEGAEMAFPPDVSQKDEGLYTCHASFYHHSATVLIQVEVTSDDVQLGMLAAICFSAAAAVALILTVSLCVFCKRTDGSGPRSKASGKKRESLAALTSLMQDPCSPTIARPQSPEYAELVRYSIVIDVKTTV